MGRPGWQAWWVVLGVVHLSVTSRKWIVRTYLLAIPCLWWQGVSQAQAQAVAWQVATVGLVCVVMYGGRLRMWSSGPVGILLTLIGWATVWGLIQLSPSAKWIEQSVVWLALMNVGYVLSQQLGYDPLFETNKLTGLMGRPNTLSALWLISVPLAHGWMKWVLVVAILWLHNWTAMLGIGLLGAMWVWRRKPEKALFGLGGLI